MNMLFWRYYGGLFHNAEALGTSNCYYLVNHAPGSARSEEQVRHRRVIQKTQPRV